MSNLTNLSRRSFMIMPLALMACKPGDSIFEFSGLTMGTVYNVVAVDRSRSVKKDDLHKAIEGALSEVIASMSNWEAGSEISRFNASSGGEAVKLSPALAEVMTAAAEVNRASAGRFDTTMGPLIELWGFGANGPSSLPGNAEVEHALSRSGHDKTLVLSGDRLAKSQSHAQVYLAAIGKGYGADVVGRALESFGINDYLVEIGGDLYASGKNPDGLPWQIGVETPDATGRGVMDVVGVSGMGLASSGDYRNYFEEDGKRYSHVIDPATGRPITHQTASATVIAENAMLADAWATAMLTLGRERGLEIARRENVAVLFIERDAAAGGFKTAASDRFDALTA